MSIYIGRNIGERAYIGETDVQIATDKLRKSLHIVEFRIRADEVAIYLAKSYKGKGLK